MPRLLNESLEEEARLILKPLPRNVLSKLNEEQLWSIYISLYYRADDLVEPLRKATAEFACKIHRMGKQKYDWI